jgi:methylenetetrahydrofolate dehydrogenase (NADP+)/methenyltetrahydrofolate cyclohydrolase
MDGVIVDGRKIAEEILAGIGEKLKGRTLGVVVNTGDVASDSFVKTKERVAAGLGVTLRRFTPEHIDEALACDGVVVQLPIQNADELIAKVPSHKDVDALGSNLLVRAPVAAAVAEIIARTGIDVRGKKAVVVGEGRLVGKPVFEMLQKMGAMASVVSLEQGAMLELRYADIVVSGAGSPGLIKPDMLKKGVILIDAGTSEDAASASRRIVGDCDPLCADVASVFTPVPGGVGPIAVAMLFKNLFTLARKA